MYNKLEATLLISHNILFNDKVEGLFNFQKLNLKTFP